MIELLLNAALPFHRRYSYKERPRLPSWFRQHGLETGKDSAIMPGVVVNNSYLFVWRKLPQGESNRNHDLAQANVIRLLYVVVGIFGKHLHKDR